MSAIKQLNRLAVHAKSSVLKPAPKQILLPSAGQQAAIRMMGQARAASTEGGATNMTVRDALNTALREEMDRNDNVFIMGEEVGQYNGAYKVTKGLLDKFGEKRVVDTPITEMGFAGVCVGAALAGLTPVCEFMTWNFAMQAIDQIINSGAKTYYMSGGTQQCNVTFRGPNGAAAGVGAQHSQDFTGWYGQIPGLKVVSPYSSEDAKGLLKAAIRDPNVTVFLENEIMYGESFPMSEEAMSPDFVLPLGKAKIEREGKDITLVGHSRNVETALKAADLLKKHHNVDAEVINLRTVKPLDTETIFNSIKKTNRLVSVEAGFPAFGMGSELCGVVNDSWAWDYLDAPIQRVTGAEVPTPYAIELENFAFPTPETVVKASKDALYIEE
ncbi:Pyruvate dehydrogenase E1 component subunit beta [Yarrowia sp. B02]|nr:Pyruvate dehydrogenase E1 component subunit beta [Yarrowia sp. B02]